jgi:ketosteroid isomerase-like protein
VVRYIDAVRDGMSAVIRDSFAEDAIWEYPGDLPLSGTHRGIDAIVNEFLGGAGALMAPGTRVVIELINVVAEWTSRDRQERRGLPQPQRGHLHHPRRQDRVCARVHRHPARRPRPVPSRLT